MNLKALRRLIALNLTGTLEYRGEFVIYMVSAVSTPVLSLLVWLAVSEQGADLPLDRDQLVTYYVLLGIVFMLTSSWLSGHLAEQIRLGDLSPWLLRPIPYALSMIANNLAEKAVKLLILLPMVLALGFAFRDDVRLPTSLAVWSMFLVSLLFAATITLSLDFLIGSLAFWVEDIHGLNRVRRLLEGLLSGHLIPLALFPGSLTGFLEVQPWRYTISFPLEILMGGLSTVDLARGFAWQAGYCLLFGIAYHRVWRAGLRAYAATGA